MTINKINLSACQTQQTKTILLFNINSLTNNDTPVTTVANALLNVISALHAASEEIIVQHHHLKVSIGTYASVFLPCLAQMAELIFFLRLE